MITSNLKYFMPILTIAHWLTTAEVPFILDSLLDGAQLLFPWCDGAIVCHSMVMGADSGNIESRWFPWDKRSYSMFEPDEISWKIIDYYKKEK